MQGFHRFFDRCVVVPTMDDVEIHIFGSKSLQTVIDFAHNGLPGKPGAIGALMHASPHLGRENNFIPVGVILQRTAGNLFTGSVRINIRCIKKVDAKLKRSFYNRPAVLLIQHPLMPSRSCLSKAHTAQADPGDIHSSIAKFDVVQVKTSI
ncbi:hypothetical protein D3C71_1600720 [compost metagenome]